MYLPDVHNRDPPDPRTEVFEAEQRQQVLSLPHLVPHTHRNPLSDTRHHCVLAWVIKTFSTGISSDIPTSSFTSSGILGKRANLSPNTTTSLVAGLLVTAFIILAGIFCYIYRRSIRFRQQERKRRRHHRHRRRPSGVSKMSQGSDAVAGGADGGIEAPPVAASSPPAEA
ncbi:hypothetical protein F5Y08DRAFT_295705 [Xylaria arbuscula]|nr:hypothetical protein F5Y08DRAFT_295705 [Xylaria arbuscula]